MKTRRMIRAGLAIGLASIASLVVMTGCLNSSTNDEIQPVPVAYVSLYNESPGSPDIGVVVDGNLINNNALAYTNHTGYLPFYTGQRKIMFDPYGSSNALADTTITLTGNMFYSMFLVPDTTNHRLLVLSDTTQSTPDGKGMVRLVDLSPDAGTVQLKISDQNEPLTGEAFKKASGYIAVDPKTYTFSVSTMTGSGDVNLTVPDIDILAGHFYTIIVRGYKTPPTGTNNRGLTAEVVGG